MHFALLQQQQQQQLQQQQEQHTIQAGIDKIVNANIMPIPKICFPYIRALSTMPLSEASPWTLLITQIKAFIYYGVSLLSFLSLFISPSTLSITPFT